MKLSDFRNLDFNNVGAWAPGVKWVFCILLFALIVGLGYYFKIMDLSDELERKQKQEVQLKKEFSDKAAKVANLEPLKKQLDEMQDMLAEMLRQLPNKTEMPDLLVNISQAALSAGLETQLFQPGAETVKEGFYAEKPIALRMLGSYHQFGSFISKVASLPRVVILTMHDVSLKPVGAKAGDALMLEGTVKTYHTVEEVDAAPPRNLVRPVRPVRLNRGSREHGQGSHIARLLPGCAAGYSGCARRLHERNRRFAAVGGRGKEKTRTAAGSAAGTQDLRNIRVQRSGPARSIRSQPRGAARGRGRQWHAPGSASERAARAISARQPEDGRHDWNRCVNGSFN